MSKVEDFKNAPVGATATHKEMGARAMKLCLNWILQHGSQGIHVSDEEMVERGYLLDPLEPAPTTAREALDLAWELAHPVKNGQVIPKGTQYLGNTGSGVKEYTAPFEIKIGFHSEPERRTLEPLPDPEPDWLNAHAVIASKCWCHQGVWLPVIDGHWKCARCGKDRHWTDLEDVTPLYPEEEEGEWVSL